MAKSPAYLARAFAQVARNLPGEIARAEGKTLNQAFKLAYKYSLGTLSYYDLAAMDHPRAKRHGAPRLGLPINQHTGAFVSDWQTFGPTFSGGDLHSTLANFNRVADFLEFGTPTMFAVPIVPEIEKQIQPIRIRNLNAALARALKPLT